MHSRHESVSPDRARGPVCDLCGCPEAVPLVVGRRFGRRAPIVQCRRCGLTYLSPRPAAHELTAFYRDEYRELYSGSSEPDRWFVEDQLRRGREILDRARSAGTRFPCRVLDVGCGAGAALVPFRDIGCEVRGTEPGPFGRWGAREYGFDIAEDLSDLPGEDQFDLVILSFVLEHVPSPFDVLAEVAGRVSSSAHVYVEVPDLLGARGDIEEYFHLAHLTYFTPATLDAVLAAAGFDNVGSSAHRSYSVWQVAQASGRCPKRPSPWAGPPLDSPTDAAARLRRQQRVESVERVVRSGLKPVVRATSAVVSRLAGPDVATRLMITARRGWVRARSRL